MTQDAADLPPALERGDVDAIVACMHDRLLELNLTEGGVLDDASALRLAQFIEDVVEGSETFARDGRVVVRRGSTWPVKVFWNPGTHRLVVEDL